MKKWKSRMVLGVIAITMVIGLTLFPGLAKALTLQNVIDLGATGIQIDDKLFYSFGYVASGGAPTAAQITFTPINTFGNPGFLLNTLWLASSGGVIDSFLSYNVRVLPGGAPITDVSASIGGTGQTGTGALGLGENVFLGNDATGPNVANITLIFSATESVLFQEKLLIDPVTKLPISTLGPIFVEKDFGAMAGTGSAQFSSVTNQFSEKIPEPMSLILLGSGLAGAGLYRRLRKPKG